MAGGQTHFLHSLASRRLQQMRPGSQAPRVRPQSRSSGQEPAVLPCGGCGRSIKRWGAARYPICSILAKEIEVTPQTILRDLNFRGDQRVLAERDHVAPGCRSNPAAASSRANRPPWSVRPFTEARLRQVQSQTDDRRANRVNAVSCILAEVVLSVPLSLVTREDCRRWTACMGDGQQKAKKTAIQIHHGRSCST